MTIDEIICVDGVTQKDATELARKKGWQVSRQSTEIFKLDGSQVGQHFAANCARQQVDSPQDWIGIPSWLSCMVVNWDDIADD